MFLRRAMAAVKKMSACSMRLLSTLHFGCSLCKFAAHSCMFLRTARYWAAGSGCLHRFGTGMSSCNAAVLSHESPLKDVHCDPPRERLRPLL